MNNRTQVLLAGHPTERRPFSSPDTSRFFPCSTSFSVRLPSLSCFPRCVPRQWSSACLGVPWFSRRQTLVGAAGIGRSSPGWVVCGGRLEIRRCLRSGQMPRLRRLWFGVFCGVLRGRFRIRLEWECVITN